MKKLLLINKHFLLSLLCNFISINAGKTIAFSGISGCGKSTMARLLPQKINAICLAEPEEAQWPQVIIQREVYGASAALFALRQLWLPLFIDAAALRKAGNLVCIDTYFLKITGYYLDKPGMEWLMPAHDLYLPLLKQLFLLDQKHVPDVDCVVLFDVSFDEWKLFLKARGRNWDTDTNFCNSYTRTREYVRDATIEHCNTYGIRLLYFDHSFGNPQLQVERFYRMLCDKNII